MYMKKLFPLLSLLIVFRAVANDYKEDYYSALLDKKWVEADSILSLWEKHEPGASELYPARFNYYLNKSHESCIGVYAGEPGSDTGEVLTFGDSLGNVKGYIGPGPDIWLDSLFQSGIETIDRGIKAFPRRLDFPFGKVAALKMNERRKERWTEIRETIMGVLDSPDGDWFWTDDVKLDPDSARITIHDTSFNYLADIANEEGYVAALPLAEKMVEKFPDDYMSLNMLGLIQCLELHLPEIGLKTLEKALSLKPHDGLIANNIAYIYLQTGDTIKAIEKYREVAAEPAFGEDMVNQANHNLKILTEGPEVMQKYTYFFRYLADLCDIEPGSENEELLDDVKYINEIMPDYFYGMVSPFSNDDVKLDFFTLDGKKVRVLTFPDPEEITQCKYVAFVPAGGKFQYFTLEKSLLDYWVLGGQDGGTHLNYGDAVYPEDAEGFAKILLERGLLTETPGDAQIKTARDPETGDVEIQVDENVILNQE